MFGTAPLGCSDALTQTSLGCRCALPRPVLVYVLGGVAPQVREHKPAVSPSCVPPRCSASLRPSSDFLAQAWQPSGLRQKFGRRTQVFAWAVSRLFLDRSGGVWWGGPRLV